MEPVKQNENHLSNQQNENQSSPNEQVIKTTFIQEEENILDEDGFEEVSVRSRSFYFLLVFLGLLIILLMVGTYLVYPFSGKIRGTWENTTMGMILTSKGNLWSAKIEDFQGVSGYTLVYKGEWKANGVNIYDSKKTKVQIHLDKQKIPAEEISKLQKTNSLYKKIIDNKTQLQLEYTEAGIKKIYNKKSIDNYFHFSLEPITLNKEKRVLYLNHSYFSNERIPFKEIK
ncbi:hypothetical protein [Enterococcus sp. AZ192]|uniref:hypothetical protein n=1 Tax=unclassified Enterococcus TaxID=2608891 RepID=UPI003D2658FE